jgi:tetratricopeptide (TPR) repeat protein
VAISRSKVERADNFVRKAFKRRKEGNLLSARANLEEALKIYPNYYWVQNLLKNLERSIEAEINGLKGEAQYLESSGDLSGALKRIGEALSLSPGDPSLQAELNRLQAASEKAQMELELTTVVGKVQEYMNAGRFDEAEGILRSKDVARQLGPRGDEMLKQVAKSRSRLINQRYSVARETEQKGEIEVAAGHASYVLELSRPNDPFTPEVVEFARLLGVKLFSAGKLVRAKEVWSAAYDLDPENEKLDNYLNEVNARLESLEKIKGDEGAGK